MNTIYPYVDVISERKIPAHEALTFLLPLLGEPDDRRRRKPGLGAEELLQSRHEVPAGKPVQIEQRQHLRHLLRAAHVGWQDHALEPSSVAVFLHPLVVDPRSLDLHSPGSQENLTLSGVAVANHQGASLLIPLFSGRLDVAGHLGFKSFGEHPPGSGSGDLVEVERESFVLAPNLMYPFHRCLLPTDAPTSVFPFDCSKGRYTTLKGKSSIHNFRLYLAGARSAP